MDKLLEIKNLHARIGEKEILRGIDLSIGKGEIHAVMGPNGAGKSTLSAVLTGKPDYEVTEGSVTFLGRDLLAMAPEERSWAGLFLSFQYPVEIPGVTITAFMKAALAAQRKARGEEPLSSGEFLKRMKEKMAFVKMNPDFAKREVNVGFSGGEKKRNEIFQMAMLEPVLSILDETDSSRWPCWSRSCPSSTRRTPGWTWMRSASSRTGSTPSTRRRRRPSSSPITRNSSNMSVRMSCMS